MVSASIVLSSTLTLLGSTAQAWEYYIERIPNAGNVDGYAAIGHTDGTGKMSATTAFGKAFSRAGKKWTVALCQADTDGDGQTNGQELGDPCCEWTQSLGAELRWTSGVSHPSDITKMSDPELWANITCVSDTADTTPTTTGTGTSGVDKSKMMQPLPSAIALASCIALAFF